tara:strand:- start:23444 stop:23722 length:279 start_codon:yes stop_codon:yes gene_type:complete
MKELEKEFIGKGQVKGFLFTQIKKTEFGYIYKVVDAGNLRYEVFKRKLNVRFECISYPSNKAFGIWAFTTPLICRANEILEDFENAKEVSNV